MKNYLTMFILFAFIFGCKKKKEETPTPDPQPAPVNPTPNKIMTAKINGVAWAMGNNAYVMGKYIGSTFSFGGKTNYASTNNYIELTFGPNIGVYTFSTSPFGAIYTDSAGVGRNATASGTINITEIDTFQYGVKKLKATFGFVTFPMGGKTYTITNGVVDWTQ